MNKKIQVSKSKILTYLVLIFSLTIVILSVISLIFPSFFVSTFVGTSSDANSFELGSWSGPFFIVNLSILVFSLLYYKKRVPSQIDSFFHFILKFEVSRKVAIIVFSVMIGIYIIFSVGELRLDEIDNWKDWKFLKPFIEEFPFGGEDKPALRVQYVNNFLLFSSLHIFQNVKVIPFIASISLVFLIYFFTSQITKKRFAGLVAVAIVLQSHTFLRYDTTATFSNFWTSFYLLSLYLVNKKWPFSPLAYIGSIFSKALTMIFLPMSLFFIYRTNLAKKTKILLSVSYLIIFFIILGSVVLSETMGFGKTLSLPEFDDFVTGLTAWAFQLRIDGLILVFLLPLVIGLVIRSLQGLRVAESILILISGILLSASILAGFTEFNIQPYRWIPLIAFFAIGVGVLLSKTSTNRSVE